MKVLLAGAFGNLGFEILKVLVEHCGKPDSLREYRSGASAGYSVEDIEITYTKVNALGMDEKVTLKLNDKDSKITKVKDKDNLYTFTKFKGYDPEVGANGIYSGGYPRLRKWTFGIDFNF